MGASIVGLLFAFFCCRRRPPPTPVEPYPVNNTNPTLPRPFPEEVIDEDISISNSGFSNDSLISVGSSLPSDPGDEEFDDTHNLADEFDKYKNDNLEKVRTDIVGTIANSEDMMSQALTKVLMDDVDDDDIIESTWHGSMDKTEIEASVYWEVNDWLKSKEGASLDERSTFMQEKLNKMVATVHQGAIEPENALRTMHGIAAMLGLELEEELPQKALLVTGMRKKVSRRDVSEAFTIFGEIESVSVTSNQRGFGLVRYRTVDSAQRALDQFRRGEIIVQDVAVMIKLLKPDN